MSELFQAMTRRTVPEVFEREARAHPGQIALSMEGRVVSYIELDQQSERLAHWLSERGVRSGARVGVCVERGFEMVVAILGILKAGAAYVPLDPGYPAERLEFMRRDAVLSALITGASLPDRVISGDMPILRIEEGWLNRTDRGGESVESDRGIGVDAAAYLMYTSGSTGTPKGVVVSHRGITRLVCSPDYVNIGAGDVFLQLAPISFDASTFEIWGALLNGARLAVMPPGPVSLAQIGEAIRREGVTILWLTGGLFNLMVDERLGDLRPLKQLLIGGEALSVAHVEKALVALENTQLINGYGPTENTTFTCCHRIQRGENFSRGVPIGRPIRGTRVKVVDAQLGEVASGEEGELLAGGEGVALGYWNRPELTAERFVRDPADPEGGALFYRTGDQVRSRSDGVIEFLGRRDGQVKLRGFRIELGEIEAAIRKQDGVRDCAVKAVGGGSGQEFLAAYVVRERLAMIDERDLSAHVSRLLPEHMWPGAWVFLERLPLNPNGKVDRGALPDPLAQAAGLGLDQPSSDLERVIGEAWRQVMGGRNVGLSVSFFEAGGNSLQVTRLHERLGRQHGIMLELTDLFQFPSVRSLARHLAEKKEQGGATMAAGQGIRGLAQRQALSRLRKPPMSGGGLK